MKVEFGHSAFQTNNFDKMIDFYVNIIGLQRHFTLYRSDGTIWLTYLKAENGCFIELFDMPEGHFDNINSTHRHICFIVKDILEAAEEFHEKGITLYYGPSSYGNIAPYPFVPRMGKCGSLGFFIVDPDGNQIEYHQFTDMSLQMMSGEKIKEIEPKILANTYVPDAAWQGFENAKITEIV